jgi:hypothetical protein
MKKILTLICCTILLAATSCKKETIVGPNTTQTIIFTVNGSTGWALGNNGATYSAILDVPEIDSYALAHDAVLVYISFDGGTTYEQVPEVYGGTAYSFSYVKGSIQVDAQTSTGSAPVKPGAATIKVLLVQGN